MSVAPELLTFGVGIDTTQVEEGLAGIGPMTEEATEGMEERFGGAADGLKGMGTQATGASRGVSGIAGAVSLFNPKLGKSIRQVSMMTRSLQALKIGLGPVGIALATITAAWVIYADLQERVRARAQESAEQIEALNAALQAQGGPIDSMMERWRAFTTGIDAATLAQEKEEQQIIALGDTTIAALDDMIATERERLLVAKQGSRANAGFQENVDRLTESVADLTNQRAAEVGKIEDQITVSRGLLEIHNETIESEEVLRERAEAAARARREQADATAESSKELAEHSRLAAQVAGIEAEGAASVRSEFEELQFVLEQKLLTLKEIQTTSEGSIEIEGARAAALMQYERELAALQTKFAREAHVRRLAGAEEDKQIAAEQTAQRNESFQDASSIAGSLSAMAAQAAKEKVETNRRAAQVILNTSKALAIAEVGVNLRAGIQAALARTAGRPVAAAIAVGAQLLAAATNVAAISAQKLHQGGQLAPDERRRGGAVVLDDERVLSPEASRRLGGEAARRMERGEERGGRGSPDIYRHFGLFFDDVIEGPATTLHNYVEQDRDTGRRGRY